MKINLNPTQLNLHEKPDSKQTREKQWADNKIYLLAIGIIIGLSIASFTITPILYRNNSDGFEFFKDTVIVPLTSFGIGVIGSMYFFHQQKLENNFLHKKVYPLRLQEWAKANYDLNLSHYEAIDLLAIKDYHGSLEDFTVNIPNQDKPEFQEFGTITKTINNVKYKVILIWDKNLYKLTSQPTI